MMDSPLLLILLCIVKRLFCGLVEFPAVPGLNGLFVDES